MKIGDLFIALGFKLEGGDVLGSVDKGMVTAERTAHRLTFAVNLVNVGILAMLDTAARAGMALRNFAVNTGLSTDELQAWQHVAVVNGVKAEELTSAIIALQNASASFALGDPQAVSAWSMLGIDPTQDPFAVIQQLRARLLNAPNKGVARALLGKVGMEGLSPMLLGANAEFERWSRGFVLNPEQITRLQRMSSAWESLKLSFIGFKNQVATVLAPFFEKLLRFIERFVEVATRDKVAIAILAGAFLAFGAAIAAVSAALAGLKILAGLPALLSFLPAVAAAARFATILGVVALLVDDIVNSLAGNDAITRRIGEWAASLEPVRKTIEAIWSVWDKITSFEKEHPNMTRALGFFQPSAIAPGMPSGLIDDLLRQQLSNLGAGTVNQDVQINVNGATSPAETARAVADRFARETERAYYQSVVPNW